MNSYPLAPAIEAQFTPADRRFLVDLRRAIHAAPELSWAEHGTRDKLQAALTACGITDITVVAGTGLVACIPGARSDLPAVAVRGDIDALPITEQNELPFVSTVPGVMHACGHDMHATWAVGAGMLLARNPAAGEVRIVLQPAEEVGQGAARMLTSGALDGVAMIFGGHVDWRFHVGEVVADAGPLAASTDTFDITFTGRGGHGARPQDTRDPVIGVSAFVMDVQTIVSRRLDPALPGVITVGTVHAGTASNIIPDTAHCSGTIRATTADSRTLLVTEIDRIAQAVAAVHGLTAKVEISDSTPPLVNSARAAAWAQLAARELLGEDALRSLPVANMGGEDFAFFLERFEGCFMRIGTWRPGRTRFGVHTPKFDPDEDALFVGSAVLAECARKASASL